MIFYVLHKYKQNLSNESLTFIQLNIAKKPGLLFIVTIMFKTLTELFFKSQGRESNFEKLPPFSSVLHLHKYIFLYI